MTAATLTERRMARTRRELATAASRLFASKGYEETTIEEIAAAAEVSPRTFYRYFAHKEGVVVALAQFGIDDVIGGLRRRPAREPLQRALAGALIAPIEEQASSEEEVRTFFLMLARTPALRARWREEVYARQDAFAQALAERLPALAASPLQGRVAAAALLAAISAAFDAWAEGAIGGGLRATLERAIAMLMRPLLPAAGQTGR